MCQIRAGGSCVRVRGDCLKYLKREWNRKEGTGNKHFKMGRQAGSRGGWPFPGGGSAGTPLQTMIKWVC